MKLFSLRMTISVRKWRSASAKSNGDVSSVSSLLMGRVEKQRTWINILTLPSQMPAICTWRRSCSLSCPMVLTSHPGMQFWLKGTGSLKNMLKREGMIRSLIPIEKTVHDSWPRHLFCIFVSNKRNGGISYTAVFERAEKQGEKAQKAVLVRTRCCFGPASFKLPMCFHNINRP